MQTLVDIIELPLPAIERYRVPAQSLDITVDYEDLDAAVAPSSDRLLRARCWVSED